MSDRKKINLGIGIILLSILILITGQAMALMNYICGYVLDGCIPYGYCLADDALIDWCAGATCYINDEYSGQAICTGYW